MIAGMTMALQAPRANPIQRAINTLLFGASEPGAWYDPSDMSTLFQDSAGTTPVTAVEQPVGLMLDKSRGLALGPELVTGDSATFTSGVGSWAIDINSTIAATNGELAVNATAANGAARLTLTGLKTGAAYVISCTARTGTSTGAQITLVPSSTIFTLSTSNTNLKGVFFATSSSANLRVLAGTAGTFFIDNVSVRELPGNHATQATTTKRPVLSRRVNFLTESEFRNGLLDLSTSGGLLTGATLAGYAGAVAFAHDGVDSSWAYKSATPLNGFSAILSVVVQMTDGGVPVTNSTGADADLMLIINGSQSVGASVVSLGGGFYRIISAPTVITASNTGVVKYNTNSSRTFKVTAYDLRLATDAHLPYQRVNTDTDYDADPAKYPAYLLWDGVDDAMQTGNIDFTGTDKMTVWAGFTEFNTSVGLLTELSSNVNTFPGSFFVAVKDGGATSFAAIGATTASIGRKVTSGNLILAGAADLSIPGAVIRINSTSAGSATYAGSTAPSFGNYPLYVGARAGTSLFFNGRLGCLIVRGAQSTLSQIEATEAYIKQKMRLP